MTELETWQPEAAWAPVPSGRGASTVGLWRANLDGRACFVKRLGAPGPGEPGGLVRPDHSGYWRREHDVALEPSLVAGPGLVPADVLQVEEDDQGVTLWTAAVDPGDVTGLFAARALGRFAAAEVPPRPWLCRRLLQDRIARVEHRGGWPTLARTTAADLADVLWQRRHGLLDRYAALPQVRSHGDAVPANLLARAGDDVVAVDWSAFGTAAVGADLGYFALSSREDFDVLLEAYLAGTREAGLDVCPHDAALGARVMAVYTVVSQAEWALARADGGSGALAGKYRHPSLAPYLRALQRQFPQIEALLSVG